MSYFREPIDYNPGFPSRSPSPPQFPEYSLWGESSTSSNFNKAPERSIYPQRRADNAPRPYYHSADDHAKSSRTQRVDRLAWPPSTPHHEERSMNFRNFTPRRDEFTRSPNQFTVEQPLTTRPQLYHNVSQYDEHFSVSPQRPDEYCRSPFQPTMQFSEDPQPLMSMHIQPPRFLSPTGRSDEYCRYPFQPSRQYNKDTHTFVMPTEPPQHQFQSQRSDDLYDTRSPLPVYNSFMKYTGEQQMPQQNQSYRLQSPLQRPNEHTRPPFPTSEMYNNSRLQSSLQRPEHTRAPFPAPEMHNSSRNYNEDPLMSQTRPFRFRSPLQTPDEHLRSQFQPWEQQYNSMDYTDNPSYTRSYPKSPQQLNMQFGEDIPQILIPCKKRTRSPQLEQERKLTSAHNPSNKMIPLKPPEDIVEEIQQPELTGLEEQEPEVVVIERKSLYLHPDNFQYDDETSDSSPDPQASTSSCSSGEWTSNIFKREGASSTQCNQPSRVLPRGRKTNTLNKKLVKALSQPVKMEKGAKMMQRMGWIGGGLGKDGTGIVDPIAPNAVYATTTVGFGQEVKAIQRLPTKRENRSPCIKRNKNKKMHNDSFKTNVLLNILKFATNDMQVELYFEELLKNSERKRIHRIVEAIGNKDSNMQFGQQLRIVEDIRRRCQFKLSTQSDGEGEQRKICVYKLPTDKMFLVTPEDCRPCLTDIIMDEEEPNPFLKSIKKHMKADPESASPAPSYLIDKLVEFFLEFCGKETLTEFRFLGPFTKKEIIVINCFFALIEDLSRLCKPDYGVPIELLGVFDTNHRYYTEMDSNGFASIKKLESSTKKESKKLSEERAK